jgi:hypothetical protein
MLYATRLPLILVGGGTATFTAALARVPLRSMCRMGWRAVVGSGCDGGQESEGEDGQGDMSVPVGPVPDLVVVQADLAFGGLETLFDAPAGAGDADQFGQVRLGG